MPNSLSVAAGRGGLAYGTFNRNEVRNIHDRKMNMCHFPVLNLPVVRLTSLTAKATPNLATTYHDDYP